MSEEDDEEKRIEASSSLRRKLIEASMGYRALADRLSGVAGRLPVMDPAEREATLTELAIELRRVGDVSHEFARDAELPRRRSTLALHLLGKDDK